MAVLDDFDPPASFFQHFQGNMLFHGSQRLSVRAFDGCHAPDHKPAPADFDSLYRPAGDIGKACQRSIQLLSQQPPFCLRLRVNFRVLFVMFASIFLNLCR